MWVKIDDRMHAHRKSRAVYRSHQSKTRDVAPLGLWLAAASWAGQNQTDGWVPVEELDRWDDAWESLVDRLVAAGYWLPADRDGEPGYRFNDWHDYNDPAGSASKSGTFGNHVRWHVKEGRVEPDCEHCPSAPDGPESGGDVAPESGGDIGGRSGGDRGASRDPIALPEPEPDPIRPDPDPELLSSDDSLLQHTVNSPTDRFGEFWDTYGHKVGRKAAEQKWRVALKKPGVTAGLIIAAAAEYVAWERANNEGGKFIAHPATWLNGERWSDERSARRAGSNVSQHLELVQQLAQSEVDQDNPKIGHRS